MLSSIIPNYNHTHLPFWSIVWLLMQLWYPLSRIKGYLSSTEKDFKHLSCLNVEKIVDKANIPFAHSTAIIMIQLRSDFHSRMTPHTSPLQASYEMSFVSYMKKNDRDISRAHCIIKPYKLSTTRLNNSPRVSDVPAIKHMGRRDSRLSVYPLMWCAIMVVLYKNYIPR